MKILIIFICILDEKKCHLYLERLSRRLGNLVYIAKNMQNIEIFSSI